jgi:hypothetical protein
MSSFHNSFRVAWSCSQAVQKRYGANSNKGSDALDVRSLGKGRLEDQVRVADWRHPWLHQRGEMRR